MIGTSSRAKLEARTRELLVDAPPVVVALAETLLRVHRVLLEDSPACTRRSCAWSAGMRCAGGS